MSRIAWFVSVLVLAAALDVPVLHAQTFQGTGQQATGMFALETGLAVFELEHQGTGAFSVRLLDEQGRVVEELASATGPFRGSKAVRIPQSGRYLLDVGASGSWSVRRRDGGAATETEATPVGVTLPDTASPVYKAAAEAARQVPTHSWLASGFVGGVLGGPVGAAIAVGFAGRSGVRTDVLDNGGVEQGPGFDAAFEHRVREARKKKAFIGGMLGSGVFLAGIIWMLDIAGGGQGGAPGGDNGPGGGVFSTIPR